MNAPDRAPSDPPRAAEWLVEAAVARSNYGDALIGDLREGFAHALATSPGTARRWYWRCAVSITIRYFPSRLRAPRAVTTASSGENPSTWCFSLSMKLRGISRGNATF